MSFFSELLKWRVARFNAAGNGIVDPLNGTDIRLTPGDVAAAGGTLISVPTGYTKTAAATAVDLSTLQVDTDGTLVDLVNDYVNVPAAATHVKVMASVAFAANATGLRYVALEQYFAAIATWLPVTGLYDERMALTGSDTPICFSTPIVPVNPASFPRMRVAVGQSSGAALNCTPTGVTFEFFTF